MALNIHSGDFKKKVVFKKPTVSVNDEGGKEFSNYSTEITTFAAIGKSTNKRVTEADGTSLLETKEYYIRWSEDRDLINEDWVMIIDGKEYVIHSIQKVEEKERYIKLEQKSILHG